MWDGSFATAPVLQISQKYLCQLRRYDKPGVVGPRTAEAAFRLTHIQRKLKTILDLHLRCRSKPLQGGLLLCKIL